MSASDELVVKYVPTPNIDSVLSHRVASRSHHDRFHGCFVVLPLIYRRVASSSTNRTCSRTVPLGIFTTLRFYAYLLCASLADALGEESIHEGPSMRSMTKLQSVLRVVEELGTNPSCFSLCLCISSARICELILCPQASGSVCGGRPQRTTIKDNCKMISCSLGGLIVR